MSVIVEHITKLYGAQKALNDISFEVKAGQVVGFLGPNGAGKSTTMKILTCFLPQSSGKASVCGYDVNENSLEVRQNVGYLPEHNPLYLDMYVKEYLGFIAGVHGIKLNVDKRVADMIALTGLEVEQKKKIGALSKGYRQRVGLAQALIHDPKVLILDEPTSGLDPNQLAEIRSLIKEIGKQKTIILSTHIMQEVQAICDQVIIINKGSIVANDSTSMLQQRVSSQNIVIVEFDKATSREKLLQISGLTTAEALGDNKWKLTSGIDHDIRALLFNFAVQEGLAVLTLQKQEQNLEQIFQQLTMGS
jgi:ABC-2 type transport system ATP-binding protein